MDLSGYTVVTLGKDKELAEKLGAAIPNGPKNVFVGSVDEVGSAISSNSAYGLIIGSGWTDDEAAAATSAATSAKADAKVIRIPDDLLATQGPQGLIAYLTSQLNQ